MKETLIENVFGVDTQFVTYYYLRRREIMKSYSSREVIKILRKDGWYEVGCDGDHHQFKHPRKKGRVTITHPRKDFPIGTLKNIEKQAGIKFL